MNRGLWIAGGAASLTLVARAGLAQELTSLDVAYAGSMGSMMEGPVKAGVAQALQIDMHGRAQGSDALAKLIVAGSIAPDVFVPVTPGPMLTVLKGGKARLAVPVARTEMVIAYSPKSRFAGRFADAAAGKRGALPWWQILQQPDPQGRNIIFTLQLAQEYYRQPGLAGKILGDTINPSQIFSEPTVEARLQSGELDAAAAYKIQPGPFGLPYVRLAAQVNLGDEALRDRYAKQSLELGGRTFHPEPLVYYAAVLDAAAHKDKALAFVTWLTGAGQAIFGQYFYDPPAGASPLRA